MQSGDAVAVENSIESENKIEKMGAMGSPNCDSWKLELWEKVIGAAIPNEGILFDNDVVHLVGTDEIRKVLLQLSIDAVSSVDTANPTVPPLKSIKSVIRAELAMIDKGIHLRALYPKAARNNPTARRYARAVTRRGSKARAGNPGDVRYVIWDDCVAVLADTGNTEGYRGDQALLVRTPALISTLRDRFENRWNRGIDLGESFSEDPVTSRRDALVLEHLARGLKDVDIAEKAVCSIPTVERTTAKYRKLWNLPTRTALASEAAKRGWGDEI